MRGACAKWSASACHSRGVPPIGSRLPPENAAPASRPLASRTPSRAPPKRRRVDGGQRSQPRADDGVHEGVGIDQPHDVAAIAVVQDLDGQCRAAQRRTHPVDGSRVGGARHTRRDVLRPARPAPLACEGPRRRPVRRAADRGRSGPGRGPVAGPFQPGVPQGVRRTAARLSADAPPGARGDVAPHHRPTRRRHLHGRRADAAWARSRPRSPGCSEVAGRLPGVVPAGRGVRDRAGLRRAGVRPSATPHVSRRRSHRAVHNVVGVKRTRTRRNRHDQGRQHAGVGARPGRRPRLLHQQARHGGPVGRHDARDGRLPLAGRRLPRARTTSRSC